MADAFVGCICKNTVDIGPFNFNPFATTITWAAEDVDTNGFHSTSVNTERITIPAGMNGRYGILSVFLLPINCTTGWENIFIYRNDGLPSVTTVAYDGHTGANNVGYMCCHSPPLLLATNDYFTVKPWTADISMSIAASASCFTLMVVG